MNENLNDERLWKIAKARATFKKSIFSYLVVGAFLWAIWWFTRGRYNEDAYPWPIWPMLGWGIGLAFQYFNAYNGTKEDLQLKEFKKLKEEEEKGFNK
jgi:hypothetical protein